MTKKEMVDKIAEDLKMKQVDVKKIVQETLDCILAELCKGETIEFRNFGVFKVKKRKQRKGRNPKTGQEVPVPERRVVVFKPGLLMKQRIK